MPGVRICTPPQKQLEPPPLPCVRANLRVCPNLPRLAVASTATHFALAKADDFSIFQIHKAA